ncbi:MFS transporter [Luteimicrobium subarcticum]|uniref:Putative MFS family arabinose efflux permease n=1 Tax=Luteimicrobium subarcticum TaxID=620910 RepID=A0A2M8WT71_9MICO|nr:MFS transporter [Luteimicrobium subarcticum]PJI94145.1 putative MFS family arabinose efflux permease [Luteimicrobium subarcticum]
MASTRNEPNKTAIYATALTAFFAIAGIAIVDPILPVIGAELGATSWQIELLFTAYIAIMAIGMIPAVLATGKFGFKKILVAGVSLVGLAAILASLSQSIGQLAVLRGFWGLGNAMFFATAMVLLVSLANDRNWVVELFETCVGLGFAVGPLLGGLLGQISWRIPFLACGVFMVVALVVSSSKLKDPAEKPAPLRVGNVFSLFKKPAFVALSVVTATYNYVFFVVLGWVPFFLGLDVVPLGLVFTGWGIGLAIGILVVGHRMAHKIGAVQTVGIAIVGVLAAVILFALDLGQAWTIVVLVFAGLCMGLVNANLTDLSLALGSPDRRATTGAFNLVRWGFAAPAPVIAGLVASGPDDVTPFWIAAGVLAVGIITFLATAHVMARGVGERVLWQRWNKGAAQVEGVPEEALGEV